MRPMQSMLGIAALLGTSLPVTPTTRQYGGVMPDYYPPRFGKSKKTHGRKSKSQRMRSNKRKAQR